MLPFLIFGTTPPEATWDSVNAVEQRQLAVFAWFIPASTAFVTVVFIIFYHFGLLRPLGYLVKGVRRIEDGNFDAPVPIISQDEIGSLAKSLNKMATSLKATQEELETRVEERTAALQASLVNLKAAQAQLIQSEKMASLGELTAGIAHEIQNPLNFVNNFSDTNTELLAEAENEFKGGNNDEGFSLLKDIKDNEQKIGHHGRRAEAIVKGMLEHSRTTKGEKQAIDLNALCDEYLRLAYHGIRAKDKSFNANLKTNFENDLGKANLIPQEIGRVLLNLFNNAFYAVGKKMKQAGEGYEPTVTVSTKKEKDRTEIIVQDNGTGIPSTAIDKIFQPFFTTKPTGQGTGLGLSLSYDIVKAHGGELKVESRDGEGAVFTIELPA
jgi:signal transduction histidine kinase